MTHERKITLAIGLIGTILYAVLAFSLYRPGQPEFAGEFIYNHYWLALMEGRFDIPARIAALEGHYDAEGRAFVYNGLAPLIVRAAAMPFVDLARVSVAPVTVFLFTWAGTVLYHRSFARVVESAGLDRSMSAFYTVLIGLMIWITAPGSLLIVNSSVYHEPIAVAFFSAAVGVTLMVAVAQGQRTPWSVLVPIALAAALCVHARPHVAIGLYAGVVLLILIHLRREGFVGLGRIVLALGLMMGSGLLLIGWNYIRFEDLATMHGSFGQSALEYGFTYWGLEPQDSPRAITFQTEGRFLAARIPANLFLYVFDTTFFYKIDGGTFSAWALRVWSDLTDGIGFIRIEIPWIGLVWLWTPWMVLIAAAFLTRQSDSARGWLPLLVAGLAALLLASYATVTLRYRVDLWPVVATLALLALPRMLDAGREGLLTLPRMTTRMAFVFLFGAFFSVATAIYNNHILRNEGSLAQLSEDTCIRLAEKKGFDPDDVTRICTL
ncbi:MAG: hypothetical protein AAF317_05550 [Pseudomonadota bacterium]